MSERERGRVGGSMLAGERVSERERKRFSHWLCPNPSPSQRSSGAEC